MFEIKGLWLQLGNPMHPKFRDRGLIHKIPVRPSPFFFRLASSAFHNIESVGRIKKKNLEKITS